MNSESDIIIALCAVFEDEYKPLTRAKFWKLYHDYGDNFGDMAYSKNEALADIMKRRDAISFGMEKLEEWGIRILTVLDKDFPAELLEKLGDFCPPLLYAYGNLNILRNKFVGYVGSRNIDEEDIVWTENKLQKDLTKGYKVVTGGANGIDSVAAKYALESKEPLTVFLPVSITDKSKKSFVGNHLYDQNLLLLSHISPFTPRSKASFISGAMERNRFIYALSTHTVVVRSGLNNGGTWKGAVDAIKHNWTQVFVWDNKNYPGNQKLIEMGAVALSDAGEPVNEKNISEQLSLFT
ncbi:MAG: DNA-protecting protein DprA [Selenomonadaceae bacterium]|nr:DNA-protecting protein DprA [Selenomonadaceae bacterium]